MIPELERRMRSIDTSLTIVIIELGGIIGCLLAIALD